MEHPSIPADRARAIRLLVLDVDGILTNGEIVYTSGGEEVKAFHIQDGLGIKLLQQNGIDVAIITGRRSPMVERRAAELGINDLIQGREDKLAALRVLCEQRGLSLGEVAYMGDDLPDLAAIRAAGLGVSVADAHPAVRDHAIFCTLRTGGRGAVRELADCLLQARGQYQAVLARFLSA